MKVKHLAIVFGIILGGLVIWRSASALQWRDEVDVQFTFNTALSISLSSEGLWIDELSPSTAGDSNEMDIIVRTNNLTGYKLFATVGDGLHNYRTLLHTNGTNNFASLDVGSSVSSFPAEGNTWGYSTDEGSTYSGLPLYNDETSSAMLNSSAVAATQTTPFLIGARAQADQAAGDYTNVINFTAVTNAAPVTFDDAFAAAGIAKVGNYYPMQGATHSNVCSSVYTGAWTNVVDTRDGQIYKIAKLEDGKCWMLDNLRFDIVENIDTISLSNTNISSADTLTSLKSGNRASGNKYATDGIHSITSSGGSWANSYDVPYIATGKDGTDYRTQTVTSYGLGSGVVGVYYNYCAATAGSYCYDEDADTGDASEDVCPAGWRMPTGGANTVATDGRGEYQALYTAYSSNAINFRAALSTPLSGLFSSGSASNQGSNGFFWSSTFDSSYNMYYLSVTSSVVGPQGSSGRNYGYSIRCVLK